jgi:hypothetical protein
MHRSNLKTAYLQAKTVTEQLAPARQHLWNSEVQTLRLLAAEVGFTAGPNATLLNLGCADRFLEPACEARGWDYVELDYTDVDFEVGKLPLEANSVDVAMSLCRHRTSPGSREFPFRGIQVSEAWRSDLPVDTEFPTGLEEFLQRPDACPALHTDSHGTASAAQSIHVASNLPRTSMQAHTLVPWKESLPQGLLSPAFSQ